MTKRKCKNVDITNTDHIKRSVIRCMSNKAARAWERPDVVSYWTKHHYSLKSIADELSAEIKERRVSFPMPRLRNRKDTSSGKDRTLTIEDIKEQYYDYIAFDALDELQPMIGDYQIACVPGKGPIYGARVIKGWLQDDSIRYAVKADVQKCYPSIRRQNMMAFLRKHIKNNDLLYLIDVLLQSAPDGGLPIGSYLSIRLCALYLSQLYHHIGEAYWHRGKNAVRHVLFFLDDIFIFGANARQLHKVVAGVTVYAKSLGLDLHSDWRLISLNPKDQNAHIDSMGYRIYRNHITMRRRDYVKTKRAFRIFNKRKDYRSAKSAIAYYGLFIKVTDSYRFRRKYNIKKLNRKARKEISNHDKGNILRTPGTGNGVCAQRNDRPVSTVH